MKSSTLCWSCISKKIKAPISPAIAMEQATSAFRGHPRAIFGRCDNCGKEDHGCAAIEPIYRNKRRT